MKKYAAVINNIKKIRHSAHYETAMLDIRNSGNDLNPIISFEEFFISGPVFQPSLHAGVLRLTLVLPDSKGSLIISTQDGYKQIAPGELYCLNAGTGVVYKEKPVPGTSYIHGINLLFNTQLEWKTKNFQEAIFITKLNHQVMELSVNGVESELGEFRINYFRFTKPKTYHLNSHEKLFIYLLSGKIEININGDLNVLHKNDFFSFSSAIENKIILHPSLASELLIFRSIEVNEKTVFFGNIALSSQEEINTLLEKYSKGYL